MNQPRFEVTSTRELGRGVFLRLEEVTLRAESGQQVVRDVVRHPGGAAVLPVDDGRVWLIRQHRVALGRYIDEIPAGKLDQPGETTEEAARRELREELGATARRFEYLATMAPSPGYTDETIDIFLAEGLEFFARDPQGAEEIDSSIHAVPIAEAIDSIGRGELTDGKTLVALLEFVRRRT